MKSIWEYLGIKKLTYITLFTFVYLRNINIRRHFLAKNACSDMQIVPLYDDTVLHHHHYYFIIIVSTRNSYCTIAIAIQTPMVYLALFEYYSLILMGVD